MRKFLGSLVVLFLMYVPSKAQNVIAGKVTDAKVGLPLSGVSVRVKGSSTGVQTDNNGDFRISATRKQDVLVISYVGYAPEEISVGNKNNILVSLSTLDKKLEEIVIVAYGTSNRTNITGSIATVTGAAVENKPFTSVDKALQGVVAGLQSSSFSGAPGSATSIRIRGIGTLTADANPLWVIDGVYATIGDLTSNTTTANALSTLNPDDIESISVLKDAAATAIYGSRAANGVILVTTKKGKSGKTHLNFSTEVGQASRAFDPPVKPLSTLQYRTVFRQGLINAGFTGSNAGADSIISDPVNGFGIPSNYINTNTNWFDQVTHTANQSQYNLNLNGGSDKTQFYASGGFFNQDGTVIASSFKRYNGSLSISHKANEKMTFSAAINGGFSKQSTPTNGGTFANPVLASFFLLPWYTPYNSDGSVKFNDPTGQFPLNGGVFNPIAQAKLNTNSAKQTTIRGFVMGEYKILANLKFTSRYSAEYISVQEDSYRNPFYGDGFANHGDAFASYKRIYNYTWSNFFDFRQTINKEKDISFDVKLGYEAQAFNQYLLQAGGQAFPRTLSLQYLASAATPTSAFSLPSESATTSFFSGGDINFKDRYIISGSFRRDGSSVFGPNNRYGNFYSVGGTWNLNEEHFLKSNDAVSLLKLRASYGGTGNSNGFGFYTALPTYGFGTIVNNGGAAVGINYTGLPGSAPTNVGNLNLTWEKSTSLNIGIDWGLWKNRFYGTIEYYDRKTTSLLLLVPLSQTSGFPNGQNQNIGSLDNKGIEITLGGRPVVTRNFSWDIGFNFAHNTNKVTALYQNKPVAAGQFNYTVGYDAQTYYFRQWAGVDPTNGAPQWFTDATLKQKTSDISKVTHVLNHSASPKLFGSITNTFTYKSFSLTTQFYYNYGNYLYDSWGTYLSSEGLYLGAFNQYATELKAWQKPGDITNTPQIIYGGNNNSYINSTRFTYKGDYIRLRDIQLTYSLPASLLRKLGIANLSVYIHGTNLLTFGTDKNLPFDPENGISSTANLEIFIPKTITGGIRIGL
jgi:TonB-linked SusC/RagA family outer membrane protein